MLRVHFIWFVTTSDFVFAIYGTFKFIKRLGQVAFLSFHVKSINIKGNILSKFINKNCKPVHFAYVF